MLRVCNLCIQFGGLKAVDDLSFDVEAGEIFTIIGPNGAGKTTVFNLLSRLYAPTGGDMIFDGQSLLSVPANAIAARGIARTFQNIELFDHATVLQNLLVGRNCHGTTNFVEDLLFLPHVKAAERTHRRAVEEVIDFLELAPYRDQIVANLPYGIRKVVEIGRALAINPKLLLLDEPASGLSPEETSDLAFWIRDIRRVLGITVVMVEHDMSLVRRVCDRVLAMAEGKALASGSVQEVTNDPRVIEAYLGTNEVV